MPPQNIKHIHAKNIGPITNADIAFGDLTVFVGPQATGKSILLQLLKLLIDFVPIQREFDRFSIVWDNDLATLTELYFGEGMSDLLTRPSSEVSTRSGRGKSKKLDLETLVRRRSKSKQADERMFYIPAQRVVSLRNGTTRPFSDYRQVDPFVLRHFSQTLHDLMENTYARGGQGPIFPQKNRLNAALRKPLERSIFGEFELKLDQHQHQRRVVLNRPGKPRKKALPYLVWSAGQREFVPLLLGLYWLLPPGTTSKGSYDWVVVEEPEMGLHPDGIVAVFNLILELLSRGYRVCISTHSPQVLDIVWALNFFQCNGGDIHDVLRMLDLRATPSTRHLAEAALASELKVHYFARKGHVKDISKLDPGSEDEAESGWGGLTEFSGQVGDAVAQRAQADI